MLGERAGSVFTTVKMLGERGSSARASLEGVTPRGEGIFAEVRRCAAGASAEALTLGIRLT